MADQEPDEDEPEADPFGDGDEEDSSDGEGSADDDAGGPDIGAYFDDDDDDDAAELGSGDSYEEDDEDDEARRPIYLNPLLLASLGFVLLLGVALGWTMVGYDDQASTAPPPLRVAVLPPPPPPPVAPQPVGEAAAAAAHDPAAPEPGAAEPGAAEPAAAEPAAAPEPAPEPAAAEPAPAPGPAMAAAEPAPPVADVPGAPFPEERTPLDPSPDPALVVDGPNGPLPIIGEDGRQPWMVYARPFELPPDTPRIAIVIGGLGLSRAGTQAAIQQLPGVVTLAFAPYAPDLGDWIAEARAAGHEVVLQLPMEPEGYPANDPGPHTLLTQVAAEDNLARLDWLLSRFTGYVGVTNYMGDRFTVSADDLRPVLEDLQTRGLLFLDSRENPDSVAAVVAAELEMPRVVNNRFLDTVASRISIDARLLELERIAEATGAAVGIGYPYPVTIERIAAWIHSLEARNVVIAPISALASTQPVN